MEKTGRKCSQLDCDLRPYEQLCTMPLAISVMQMPAHASRACTCRQDNRHSPSSPRVGLGLHDQTRRARNPALHRALNIV